MRLNCFPLGCYLSLEISSWHSSDKDLSPARSVKFKEENPLPGSKNELLLLDWNYNAISENHRTHVSMGIASRSVVKIAISLRYQRGVVYADY